jgi:hypothetical protein
VVERHQYDDKTLHHVDGGNTPRDAGRLLHNDPMEIPAADG